MLRNAAICLMALLAIVFAGPEVALLVAERSPLADGLPEESELPRLLGSCQVTSAFGPEVPICPQAHGAEDFSSHLHAAVVASEDRRFLTHDGVDPWAVWRAALGIPRLAEPTGGSTITQQLARTLFLSRDPTVTRKIREWILARRIERVVPKDQILTYYLNVAPQAHGLLGFEASSQYLFGKAAKDLSIMEAALLASMLPRPVRNPATSPIAAYRATVARIDLMRGQSFIDDRQALAAKVEARAAILHDGLPDVSAAVRARARRPHEHRRVRDLAKRQLAEQNIALEDVSRVFLTMDPWFQSWADAATKAQPEGYRSAALFMSPGGNVLAVAGPDYGTLQYNAAFQASRSVGSLGKVPLYILAHERPELLRRPFSNAPIRGRWPNEPNARCSGDMLLRDALALSCNRPFARLSAAMPERASQFVTSIGLAAPDNPLLTGLGGVHGDLLAVTGFFAAIANGGMLRAPRAAIAVADRDGRVTTLGASAEARRIMPPDVARAVADDLRAPVTATGGTARKAAGKARAARVAGKTGTSDGNRDAWFVGFTADFVGGVWAYAEDGTTARVGGSGYPAEAFGEIVDAYWVPRNAAAGLQEPAIEETAQATVFRWTTTRATHWTLAAARPAAVLLILVCALAMLRPWRMQVPRFEWTLEGRAVVPPLVMALGPRRP